MAGQSLWNRLLAHKFRYVVANVLVSALGFGRNLLFLKALGPADLGQVALMQTIAMMAGFFQLGLINGGYRIYAIGEREQNESINNTLFTFFLALALLALLLVAGGVLDIGGKTVWPETLMIGVAAGIATLASTWINNALIGDGKLGESNAINLIAVFLSLVAGAWSHAFGLWAALISMLIQPLCVVLLALLMRRQSRPTRLQFDWPFVGRILALGFIPYITGIFVLLNHQIERWAITYVLGPAELGRFYIVMLYATIFVLVPVSLLSLYFPRTIRAFEEGRHGDFVRLVRRHTIELLAYLSCAVGMTFTLLPRMLSLYFDKYKGAEALVYLVIPGLVALILCDPASLAFNSAKKLRPLLIYGVLTLVLNAGLLLLVFRLNMFSLEAVAIVKSISNILAFSYLALMLVAFRKNYSRQVRAL